MNLTFTVLGPPKAKERARRGLNGFYTPEATRQYEAAVGRAALAARARAGHVTWPVNAWYLVMYRVFLAKGQNVGDLDNYAKSVLDGAQKVLWKNDKRCLAVPLAFPVVDARPRTEVSVRVYLEPFELQSVEVA